MLEVFNDMIVLSVMVVECVFLCEIEGGCYVFLGVCGVVEDNIFILEGKLCFLNGEMVLMVLEFGFLN